MLFILGGLATVLGNALVYMLLQEDVKLLKNSAGMLTDSLFLGRGFCLVSRRPYHSGTKSHSPYSLLSNLQPLSHAHVVKFAVCRTFWLFFDNF